MATTIPAMKAKLGSTTYYISSMKAKDLSDKVVIPKESDEWENLSIDERYQRDINYTRVKRQIAPYLANDQDRFFGAIILAVKNFDKCFEPIDGFVKSLPALYKTAGKEIGFLTFSGGEILIPLDGQHRLKAIKFAINGRDEKNKEIKEIKPCHDLADEDVTVILIQYDRDKARKIFTRVNRYAKPTTAGQNIVTSDEDILAILARKIADDKFISSRLVKFSNNTLSKTDKEFTTLATIYSINKAIITEIEGHKVDTTKLPDISKQIQYEDAITEVWKVLLNNIEAFYDALTDKEESGDQKRIAMRKETLLCKPAAQECLVRAYLNLTDQNTKMSQQDACTNLNKLPWAINDNNMETVWKNFLWTGGVGGRIITNKKDLAVRIISYMAGETLDDTKLDKLKEDYLELFTESEQKNRKLPPRV